jgi:hypothetical protein
MAEQTMRTGGGGVKLIGMIPSSSFGLLVPVEWNNSVWGRWSKYFAAKASMVGLSRESDYYHSILLDDWTQTMYTLSACNFLS